MTEIRTDQDGIGLIRRGEPRRYKWADIGRAHIRNAEIYKGYGAYAAAKMIRRTLCFEMVDGKKYAIDVSPNSPDFANTPELLATLNNHLRISEPPVKRFNHALWISLSLMALGLWFFL